MRRIVQSVITAALCIGCDINKCGLFTPTVVFGEWWRTFPKLIAFPENPVSISLFPCLPVTFPDNVCSFVNQRPAEIAMIKQHEIGRASCRERVCQYV